MGGRLKLITLDPGLRGCGFAVFIDGTLSYASYVPARNGNEKGPWAHAQAAHEVMNLCVSELGVEAIIEFPRVYPIARQKGDQNDLLEVAGVASACGALFNALGFRVSSYYPRDWKGQVPKEVMTQRILRHLTPDEIKQIRSSGAKDHNTVDAVGIGLYRLGRL